MMTSISELIRAERFLAGKLQPQDKLSYEARLIVDKEARENLFFHKMLHRLVCFYHREKVKKQIEQIHERLFQDPAKAVFKDAVLKHFKH
jgi:hypothetical protein